MNSAERKSHQAGEAPFVSVVTPFHNSEEYLTECISSVLSQTYENFEYILVDNCSTDSSGTIARDQAKLDPRIRFVANSRLLPQVANYNHSLTLISPQSRFVKMVQADDWIFPTCLEEMIRVARIDPHVGVVGSYAMYGDIVGHTAAPPFSHGEVTPGLEAGRRFLMQDDGFIGSPTCVLFRSDLVRARAAFFRTDLDTFEDVEACLSLLTESSFGFVYQVLTYNRRGNPGFWTRVEDFNPVLLHLRVLLQLLGRQFLSASALAARSSELAARHYVLLASHLLQRNLPEFWEFHRVLLAIAGIRIDHRLLRRSVFRQILRESMHPLRTVRALVRIATDRRIRQILFDRKSDVQL